MNRKLWCCPNCGKNFEIEDGIETFFCKYCGYKITLDNQTQNDYGNKMRIKHIERKARLQEKRNAQKQYRTGPRKNKNNTEDKWILIAILSMGAIFFLLWAVVAICKQIVL